MKLRSPDSNATPSFMPKGCEGFQEWGEVRERGPEPVAPHSSLDLHPRDLRPE